MLEIDNAIIIDENIGTVKTDIGITDLTHLSTGIKTLLMIRYLKAKYTKFTVNLNECGRNVLTYIFRELNDTEVVGLLQHTLIDEDALLGLGCTINNTVVLDHAMILEGLFWRCKYADK